jgi:hypothetical protein
VLYFAYRNNGVSPAENKKLYVAKFNENCTLLASNSFNLGADVQPTQSAFGESNDFYVIGTYGDNTFIYRIDNSLALVNSYLLDVYPSGIIVNTTDNVVRAFTTKEISGSYNLASISKNTTANTTGYNNMQKAVIDSSKNIYLGGYYNTNSSITKWSHGSDYSLEWVEQYPSSIFWSIDVQSITESPTPPTPSTGCQIVNPANYHNFSRLAVAIVNIFFCNPSLLAFTILAIIGICVVVMIYKKIKS